MSALPFVLVMAGLCVALVKDLRRDPLMLRAELGNQLMEQAVIAGVAEHGHEDFAIVLSRTRRATAPGPRDADGRCRRLPAGPGAGCVVGAADGPGVHPRTHTKAATRSPGQVAAFALSPSPTGRIRVPESGHLVSGFGQYGASGRG